MHEGYTTANLILFGDLNNGAAAKGFCVETRFFGNSSEEILNDWHDRIKILLQQLGPDEALHIQWRQGSDFVSALDQYAQASSSCDSKTLSDYRNTRKSYFDQKILSKNLRRSELYIYICTRFQNRRKWFKTRNGLAKTFDAALNEAQAKLSIWRERLQNAFGSSTRIKEQTDLDNYWFLRQLMDPMIHSGIKPNVLNNFDPQLSIEDNCLFSQGVRFTTKTRFFFGGKYHSVFALKKWPKTTYPGIIFNLMSTVPNLTIVTNVVLGQKEKELFLEKKKLNRLLNERNESETAIDKEVSIEKKQRKIREIASGNSQIFETEFLFLLREGTEAQLEISEEKLKNAVLSLNGAEILEPKLETVPNVLFPHLFPGHVCLDQEKSFFLYAQDDYLADMLPLNTTFTGFLEDAEALYDGADQTLVGIKSFEQNTPQHALLFGMTGAGKSVFMEDFLLQTQLFFDYTVIVEEGLSYKNFTEKIDEEPIVFHPNLGATLNIFDTFGLPLTTENVAFIASFVANLLGSAEGEVYKLRVAQLAEYIHAIYEDRVKEWIKKYPDDLSRMERLALAVHLWGREKAKDNLLDTWLSFQEYKEESLAFFQSIDECSARTFCKDPEYASTLKNILVSGFRPEDFPTISDLIEAMKGSPKYTHNRDQIFELATRLTAWTQDGLYGKLFDGPTTLNLNRKVVHFELGKIPEAMNDLKAACGLLITGVIRQRIMSMPRFQRKRLIFEEVARFLNIPGGEQIVSEAYAQLRKFGCQTMAIVQQYAQFKNSRIRPILVGNSKQYFIMRQQDKSDLADLASDIALPHAAQETIQNFALPEFQSQKERHSSIFYFNPTIRPELGGVLKHFVTACLALVCCLFLGACAHSPSRTMNTAGLAAGGGLVGHSLGKGDKWATAGGVAGGVVAAHFLQNKATKELDKKYLEGYNEGRQQAVKQQYWIAQNMHKGEAGRSSQKSLLPIEIESYSTDGVQYAPGKVYLEVSK